MCINYSNMSPDALKALREHLLKSGYPTNGSALTSINESLADIEAEDDEEALLDG